MKYKNILPDWIIETLLFWVKITVSVRGEVQSPAVSRKEIYESALFQKKRRLTKQESF